MRYRTKEEVATRIAELRAEQGISQRRLADALQMQPAVLNRIERANRGLSTGELVRIAEALEVDVDEILCADEPAVALRADCSEDAVRESLAFFDEVIADYFAVEALGR